MVDDHSEDGTARVALAHGAKVIPSPDLPPGWLGKSWACQQGTEHGTLNVRMYPEGLGQVIQGWRKSFASSAGRTLPGIMIPIIIWISGLLITPLLLLFAILRLNIITIFVWGMAYILFFLQLYWHLWRIGRFKWYTSFLFPVSLIFFFFVFSRSSFLINQRRQVVWKGRVIKRKEGHKMKVDFYCWVK